MTTQAAFGQSNVPDPNTQIGWTVQGGGQVPDGFNATTGQVMTTLGVPGSPYAQAGITATTAALTATGNGSPGVPNPIAGNVTSILSNPGYADANPSLITPGTQLAAALVPVSASGTAFTSPVALPCSVVITGGTITAVALKALGAASAIEVGTGDGTYTVPPGAQITLTYSAAPAWTWQIS
ncbi:MAG TPA: hypothetical protein VMU95_00065 [Trebonia sp.]|nr:hypothetical protein [Trebonia sp.]